MTIVPPNTWRMIGRWSDDVPEFYIPLVTGSRSGAILQRMIDGPTEEERMASQQAAEEREAQRRSVMDALERRHDELRRTHPERGIVAELLHWHRPRATLFADKTYLECHGCPSYDDTGVEIHHEWPCPTWQTISDSTS
jgi:hypothetical protein